MVKVSNLAQMVTQKFEEQIEERINQIINLPKDIPPCFTESKNYKQLCIGNNYNCDQCEFYDCEQQNIFSIIDESIKEIKKGEQYIMWDKLTREQKLEIVNNRLEEVEAQILELSNLQEILIEEQLKLKLH